MSTFLQAAGVAMIPSVVWGWFFVSRNPESRQLVVVTFLLGTLAVVPLLLFMAGLGIQLQTYEATAAQAVSGYSFRQALGLLAFLVAVALVLVGVFKLFHMIARRVRHPAFRFGAMLLAAGLLLAATLSHDQLRENLGALGGPLADMFHFLVVFCLFMFLLEKLSVRTVANVAVAALAAVLVLLTVTARTGFGAGGSAELSSISTIFSLPFELEIAEQDSTLLTVALVHLIYLLHENRAVKLLHGVSLAFFALPFLCWAVESVSPELPLAGAIRAAPPWLETIWYANILVLAGLSVWSVIAFVRQSGPAALELFTGLYEEPLNFVGVGLFLTLFISIFHWLGLPVAAFSLIFLAFAEEYSKHLIVRFTDDDSIRSINDSIEFSIIVGLAFAFAENVLLYFPRLLAEGDTATLVLRSVLTVLMHAVASGILGYFYGLAHFSAEEVRHHHGGRGQLYRLMHRVFLFRRESLYHEAKMFEGLVLAGAYHAVFNIAASQSQITIMLVLVAGGSAYLYYLLGLKTNREKIGHISRARVHETYVRRLRRRTT
jgi:hypothetical protein